MASGSVWRGVLWLYRHFSLLLWYVTLYGTPGKVFYQTGSRIIGVYFRDITLLFFPSNFHFLFFSLLQRVSNLIYPC
jgi:hypothetical protein